MWLSFFSSEGDKYIEYFETNILLIRSNNVMTEKQVAPNLHLLEELRQYL